MEEKINIAEILKNKPQGTKLYDLLYNVDVELDTISTTDTETVVWCTNETDNNTTCHRGYSEFGTERGYPDGLQILFPSKEMRDWAKFSWKKGDVLANGDGDYCVFKEFAHSSCQTSKAVFVKRNKKSIYSDSCLLDTKDWHKASHSCTATYINTIEKELSGKLNMDTLEIEKAQPEFKDGDIITFKDRIIIIYNNSIEKYPNRTEIYYHACLKEGELTVNEYLMSCGFGEGWYSSTEEEKQQLFDALTKKGKAWDAEKKQIVDLKPNIDELKPFDKVLVRDSKSDYWRANLFGYIGKDGYCCCVYANWIYCIPYAGNEHLLGTTKDVEG
jgi:hypothetical protein